MSQQKHVTLIGEVHDDSSHLHRVEQLVNEKLLTQDIVMLALEESSEIPLVLDKSSSRPGLEPSHSSHSRRTDSKDIPTEIDKRVLINHSAEYKVMLKRLWKELPEGKTIVVAFVDDTDLSSQGNAISLGTMRDRHMNHKINEICGAHNIDEVVYAVGSAHIFNHEDNSRDHGKRLGSLLHAAPSIRLTVENAYPTDSKSYRTVQNDIDNFRAYNDRKSTEPTKPKKLALKKSFPQTSTTVPRQEASEEPFHSASSAARDTSSSTQDIRKALSSPRISSSDDLTVLSDSHAKQIKPTQLHAVLEAQAQQETIQIGTKGIHALRGPGTAQVVQHPLMQQFQTIQPQPQAQSPGSSNDPDSPSSGSGSDTSRPKRLKGVITSSKEVTERMIHNMPTTSTSPTHSRSNTPTPSHTHDGP